MDSGGDMVLLKTAWGCGGSVEDVLLTGWRADSDTKGYLRIDGGSGGCEVSL